MIIRREIENVFSLKFYNKSTEILINKYIWNDTHSL